MTDFVTDDEVFCVLGDVIPHGKFEDSVFYVKHCRGNIFLYHCNILSGEEFGKSAFDFLYGHAFFVYASIIHTHKDPERGRVPLYRLSCFMVLKSPILSKVITESNLSRRMSPL